MKKEKKPAKVIAWLAFGTAIGTSIIRLFLLNVQNSSNISSAIINFVSNIGYSIALLLLILFWYKKKSYKVKEK